MSLALRLRLLAVVGIIVGLLAGAGLFVAPENLAYAQGNNTVDLSLRALGYSDQVATGASSSFDVFFPDLGSQPGDSQLTFIYSHADILLPDFSLVSVLVNTVPVYSARLDETNVNRTTVNVNIPADRFTVGANRVSFRFELRLRQECDGDTSSARNAIVYSDTTLRYGPPANPSAPDLRDFPGQFTSQTRPNAVIADRVTAIKGQPTISVPLGIAIPPDATQAERNGAGTLLLALGASRPSLPVDPIAITTSDAARTNNLRREQLRDVRLLQTAPDTVANASRNENIILVGRASSVGASLLQGTPFRVVNGAWQRVDNIPIPADAGILLMATTPGDPRGRIFIVSGNNDTGVTKAVAILNAGNTANLLTGQGAIITDVTPTPPAALTPTKYSLQDFNITGDAATVQGFGTHDIAASFSVAGLITEPATIQIDFASAPTLEPRLSTMTALINDQPFITQLLDGKNGERRSLTAQIPPNLFRPGRNSLRFAFALQGIGAVSCRSEFAGPAEFATLFPGTSLTLPLPSRDLSNLSLGLYPFPFSIGNDPMTVIVSSLRDTDGLNTAYRLMLGTGGVTGRGVTAQLLTAAEATPQTLRGQNAVVIGFPGRNSVLDPVADQLFFVTGNGDLRLRDTGGVQRVGSVGGTSSGGIAPIATAGLMGNATNAASTAPANGAGAMSSPAAPTVAAGAVPIMGGGGSSAVPGSVAQFTGGGTGPIGVLQILPAPWDATRFMLVVAGGTVELRALAADALTRSRFAAREAVISRDMQGQLVVGEARAVPQPTLSPPASTAAPTVIAQGGSSGSGSAPGGIMVSTPGMGTAASTAGMGPTVPASVATALAGGGVAVSTGTTATGTISASGTSASASGSSTLASGTSPVGISGAVNTPAAVVSTPAVANTAGATSGAAVTPAAPASVTGTVVATGTRPAGTLSGATTGVIGTPSGVIPAGSGTPPAVGTLAVMTQVIGTRGAGTSAAGTGTVSPVPVSVLGNTATQTATAAAGTGTSDQIFGLSRTLVFGILAAAALAVGIVVIALFLQGQQRVE